MQSRITYGKWRLQIFQTLAISSNFAPQTTWRTGGARGISSNQEGSSIQLPHDTPETGALRAAGRTVPRNHDRKAARGRTANVKSRRILRDNAAEGLAEGTEILTEEVSSQSALLEGESQYRSALGEHGRDHSRATGQAQSSKLPKTVFPISFEAEEPTRITFNGWQAAPSERAKLIRQKFSVKNRFKTVTKPPIPAASRGRSDQWLKQSGIPNYSEVQLKSMRSSPSIIIDALKRGRLTPKARNFNFHAWSNESSATAMVMRYLLGMKSVDIAKLRTEAREAGARISAQGTGSSGFKESFLERLDERGYTEEDVHEWARIALAPDGSRALLYLESQRAVPPNAIFNEVLRDSSLDVRSLRKLITSCKLTLVYFAERKSVTEAGTMQDNQFITLFTILMKHARRIAPSMLAKSIAPLIAEYCRIVQLQESSKARMANRLHTICNTAVVKLSLTPKRQPMEGMDYAWKAQAKILELGDSFEPSLILDAPSYRAIIRVLLACKKTEWEEHAVTHLHRTWPPWRKTQDGMDARIQPDDELTRVVSVVRNLIRAGHPKSSFDNMAMILGGRDIDGTPTIPTRTILKARYKKEAYDAHNTNADLEWAARVRATRDIREAWGAFRACEKHGLKPTQGMFEEMVEKLVYDHKRESGARSTPRIPGAGREVAHYHNENLSETELQRVSPPSIDELLELMKSQEIKLSEKSLCLLVRGARNPRYARDLMLDYGVDRFEVLQLSRGKMMQHVEDADESNASAIPEPILTAYIQLLCRFSAYKWLSAARHGGRREGREYLLDVIHILKRAPNLRVAWHTFVKTIALIKNTSGSTTYDFSHSSKLWAILHEALQHRRELGAVDADHFAYACYGFYNALEGERQGYAMETGLKKEGIDFINGLWLYLTQVPGEEQQDAFLPTLLHEIKGWHLHAYVRLLARTGQKEGIVDVLFWITNHENELDSTALNRSNGLSGLRRTLIAMRVYAISTRDADFENRLREMAESIPQDWGGWATDQEVEEYVDYTSEAEGLRDIDTHVKIGHGIIERGGEKMFSSAENYVDEGSRNTTEPVGEGATVIYRPM